jgi:glucose 1-dehydrogenase
LDSHQPSGRSGTPEEVGQLCLFLASDAASYITAAEIIISSGSELGYGVRFPWSLA